MTTPNRQSTTDPQSAPPMGVGLGTCALSLAILGTLGYAVTVSQRTPDRAAEAALADASTALEAPLNEPAWPPTDATSIAPPSFGPAYPIAPAPGPAISAESVSATPVPAESKRGEPSWPDSIPLDQPWPTPLPPLPPAGDRPADLRASASEKHDEDRDEEPTSTAGPAIELDEPTDAASHQADAQSPSGSNDLPETSPPVAPSASTPSVAQSTPENVSTPNDPYESPILTGLSPSLAFAAPPAALDENALDWREGAAAEPMLAFDDIEAQLAHDASMEDLLTDAPAVGRIDALVAKDVQAAYSLGRHGAVHAARGKFVTALRKIAQSLDAERSTDRHTAALAAGLTALDEAADFLPKGAAVEAGLDVAAVAASHETPLLKNKKHSQGVLPHEAVARYHRYAQHKLAAAVAPSPAGSMALHGLGKTHARLAELDGDPLAERASLAMYRAAIETHPQNYLAANELGVLLAKAGRYETACRALERAVASGGQSTVYHNLAAVQQRLGHTTLAQATSEQAERLAMIERAGGAFSKASGVQWMKPEDFARLAGQAGQRSTTRQPGAQMAVRPNQTAPPLRSQAAVR